MSHNLVDNNKYVGNKAYLIITKGSYGRDTLNGKHAHTEYILLAGTIVECHDHNHNILSAKPNTTGRYRPGASMGVMLPSITRA